jgi:Domain of unknown function (DUF4278)
MKISYRGASYDYDSLKASSDPVRQEKPYNLCYRGIAYQVTPKYETAKVPVQKVTRQLIYRGNC